MRLQLTVIDSPDPPRSAAFYSALLELPVSETEDAWVQLAGEADGVPTLAFQLAPGLEPPGWPDGEPQRVHLDLEVDDLDEGERRVLDAGARKAERQPGVRFRVYLDPLGHLFCLVLRHEVPTPG